MGENFPDRRPTWGLRWWQGFYHVHLMWMHWRTGHWTASRSMVRKRYRSLERALKDFEKIEGAVIIFGV